MRFRYGGRELEGTPLRVMGTFLAIEFVSHTNKGLQHKAIVLIGSHDAVDASEFWRAYYALGGEELVDEDGNPIWTS